jgi:uncharacterized protein YjdB
MTGLAMFRSALFACFAALTFVPAFSQTVTVSPASVSFGNQAVGTSSSIHNVKLKNGQSSAISISGISTNLADYSQTNNCPMNPATLAAGASCSISITFAPSAQGGRNATLTVVDTGLSSPQLVTLTGSGTAPILESIAVTPSMATIIAAETQQFTATGTYSDGSTQNLTTTANWTSSNTSVANIGLHTALAKGIAAGTVTITATSGKVSGSAALTITAAVLTSITVRPGKASVVTGKTQQFTATGTYNNGTTQNLTNSAIWTSSAISVATVSSGGLATGVAQGSATITATSSTISGSSTLTVTAAVLTSIAVTPVNPSFALGTTLPLVATGTYSDGSTLVLTTTATWTTANAAIATVNNQGVATSVALGSTTATATLGTISGSTILTVSPAVLLSIAVTPAIPTIPLGTTEQFTATGTYTDGSTQNITSTVEWSSGTPLVATISNAAPTQGLASAVAQGTATISASSGSVTASTTLTVSLAALVSIAVTPAAPSIALGTTEQFTATGTFTDGSTQNLTSTAAWSSDTISTATIDSAGLAQSVGVGSANITATSGTVSGSTELTVTSALLVSIAINPQTATVALGSTQQFTATGTFTDGTTQDLTQSGQWSSSAPTVATISNSAGTAGLASTLGTGTTTIGIISGTISATATLVVNPAALVSIAINPQNPTIALGTTQQFTATGTYSDGSTQDLTTVVTWSSSLSSVAIISNAVGSNGLATSAGQGMSTITATSGSISSSTTITVGSATLVSIAITPASASISVGTTQQFTATGTYTDGSTQNLTSEVNWSSSATAVVTIATGGLATGQGGGTAAITATSGSITASATLSVGSSSPLGQWAPPVYFCSSTPCVVGANAAVLNTGSVLFYYYPSKPGVGSEALLLNPITGAVTFVNLTVPEDIFCSGVTILENGDVLVTGGVVEGVHSGDMDNDGTYTTMLFNPATSTWTQGNDMNYARWYPSSVEITDGSVLELSGSNETGAWVQNVLESYDYTSGDWSVLPSSANMPNAVLQTYPRMSLLPTGNVLLSAPAAQTYQFNPSTNLWSFVADTNFGFRYFAPHVLLPGQEQIMVAGGSLTHVNGGGAATNTAEIIDMSAATPVWSYTGSMTYARYNENLVLLADGTVLAVGGGGGWGEYTNPVFTAELYNPTTAQWTVMASQNIQRAYHSTAVLLPDGRVLSSGSDNMALTEMTYEIYSPPYLFNGPQPLIQSAPTSLVYGASFTITTSDASTITRVALVRPGATTHADDFDQRYVDLAFTLGNGTIQATAPANGSLAPPGYYMLVIVNSSGVPSVMPFLLLN